MTNPFEIIETRLSSIESLLIDLQNTSPQEAATPAPELLTVQEAAEFLKLTVPTIYTKVSRCELPVMKRSKRLYFDRGELTNYVKAGRKLTNSEAEAEAEKHLR